MQQNTYKLLTEELRIAPKVLDIINEAEKEIEGQFAYLDDIMAYNQYKVLTAFQENRISDSHFAYNTGYGYDDAGREKMLAYCGHSGHWETGCESIIRTMFQSHAGLVIMPIQDLLGYGSDTRLNIPGKADGNWAYRVTKQQLDSIDKNKFRTLNKVYHR